MIAAISSRPVVVRLGLFLLFCAASAAFSQDSARDAKFKEMMEGSRLVGNFTAIGPTGQSMSQDDLYSVVELEQDNEGRWIFHYTMSYRDNMETTLEIPVQVEWVDDDTPMLVMTDQVVEGLGTFTVRLLIYDGLYAGTWSSPIAGGHMWGKLEKIDQESEPN